MSYRQAEVAAPASGRPCARCPSQDGRALVWGQRLCHSCWFDWRDAEGKPRPAEPIWEMTRRGAKPEEYEARTAQHAHELIQWTAEWCRTGKEQAA